MSAMTTNASIAPAVPGAKPKAKKGVNPFAKKGAKGKLAVPAGPNFDVSERRARHERFAMRFANAAGDRAMRQDSEKQK